MKKNKNEIYEKSIKLFSKKGIDNVTMRELADHCGLSLGAFYYHFKNKEDLVLSFYQKSLHGHLGRGNEYLSLKQKNLSNAMEWICRDRFKEFYPHKTMLRPLSLKFDVDSVLSPWAKESYFIRKESVLFFSETGKKCMKIKDAEVAEAVGRLLWLHHLAIIGAWLHKGDDHFELLLIESRKIWKWLPRFLKLPGSKMIIRKISKSLQKLEFWENYES